MAPKKDVPESTAFGDSLLKALEANWHRFAQQPPEESPEVERADVPFIPDGPDLEGELLRLEASVEGLTSLELATVLCDIGEATFELRVWYTARSGMLLLALLEKVASARKRLPYTETKADPDLAVLKVLEGIVLILTVLHAPAEAARTLERLLEAHRLSKTSTARLQAALVCLDGNGLGEKPLRTGVPPALPLEILRGRSEMWLDRLLSSLTPTDRDLERVHQAQVELQDVLAAICPGVKADYFGGCLNGFATRASDVDCVLLLNEADLQQLQVVAQGDASAEPPPVIEAKRQKAFAAAAVVALAGALRGAAQSKIRVKEEVSTARVPVLKCESSEGIDIDISFNHTLPLHNSRLLRSYADLDNRVPALGRLVKHWAHNRRVHDAYEGTLSSYSYVLLVVHYLQQRGLLPNLQDRSRVPVEERPPDFGAEEFVDGIHDAWFADPAKVASAGAEVRAEPVTATLLGLLAGFFRYFAYEFPVHSMVVSIRHAGGVVGKAQYFSVDPFEGFRNTAALPEDEEKEAGAADPRRADLQGEKETADAAAPLRAAPRGEDEAAEAAVPPLADPRGETEAAEAVASPCTGRQGEEEPADAAAARCVGPRGEIGAADAAAGPRADSHGGKEGEKEAGAAAVPRAAVPQDEEVLAGQGAAPAAKRPQLPGPERARQRRLHNRQTLCIDDPMERGRALGTTFAGMERMACEMRRACLLLERQASQGGGPSASLEELFSDDPPPKKSLWKLLDQVALPSVLRPRTPEPPAACAREVEGGQGAAAGWTPEDLPATDGGTDAWHVPLGSSEVGCAASVASSSEWQRFLAEEGSHDHWWWRERDGSWFMESNPGPWTKYLDPHSGWPYWCKDDSDWFWTQA